MENNSDDIANIVDDIDGDIHNNTVQIEALDVSYFGFFLSNRQLYL